MEDEILITGMSGRFPEADNVAEYWEKLCNKVDCITEEGRRWIPGIYGIPKRMGLLKEIDKFDNLYFGINHKSSDAIDPQARILLEVVYESIVDAGYDPDTLKGKKIGVYIGTSSLGNDSLACATADMEKLAGYILIGYCQSLIANRISYAFDFKGPSMVVDTACSSGASALCEAVQAISRGDIDAAIVGSSVLHLKPEASLAFKKLKMLSKDGKCKSFDASGDGYAKSEAIVSLFIQKSNDARRMYASIVNIKTNTDGYKIQGITFPSYEMQKCLMLDVLKECNLDPGEISYMEAHATGTKAGDPVEISAIRDAYCCDRKEPLLMGSVKSNIGHTEASSSLCSIIKVLLAMKTNLLPPNLHFNEPILELKPLIDKQIKVITEPTPWNGTYAVLNSFGLGGVNVNIILKRPCITSKTEDEKNNILPQLILSCGRTEESVLSVFENSILTDAPREFFALFHKVAYTSPKKKPYRGYTILGTVQDIQLLSYEKRPVWYIFSGMGTQWSAMAKDLMQIEIFRKSIAKSEEILKPYVPDLMDILTNEHRSDISRKYDADTERNIIPAFVSIATMQIALVDVLNELGLKPDGIVGHSVGELGCAYADGCFTAEQMLLASYWRGKATQDSDLIQGSMAATGMTWSEAQKRCPEDIYPVCHNAEESVTISGPADSMKCFMSKLRDENAFVREINTCGYAYHCDYVLPVADILHLPMEKLIPDPKKRSCRWISSSYPELKWKTPDAQHASASYFVHNLLSPVLFCDAIRHIPENAIVIEIGPHQVLQSSLKREIGADAVHISLMKRNTDNILHLLSSIGKMYTAGLNPDIQKLYSPVTFPVPRNTPMISPLIKWDHSETSTVPKWDLDVVSSIMHHEVDPRSMASTDRYLLGHCIDGRTLFPSAGYIVLAWKTFSNIKLAEKISLLPVAFENVKFIKPTLLSEKAKTIFTVSILKSCGYFEISEKGNVVCTGLVSIPTEHDKECISSDITVDKESLILNEKDIYNEFWLRGYEYGPSFQGIKASNISGSEGILKWNENWTVYLDTLLQLSILSVNKRVFLIPTEIQSLVINPMEHGKYVEQELNNSGGIPVKFNSKTREYFTPGVYAKNVKASYKKRKPVKQTPFLEEYKFFPYIETCCLVEDKKNKLKEYNSLCLSMSQKLLHLTGKFDDDKQNFMNTQTRVNIEIDKYLKAEVNDNILLKCFLNIINNVNGHDVIQYSKDYVRKYLSEFENDVLHKALLEESILRTACDIVFENKISRTLKVLEITENCSPISSKINEYIPIPEMLKISYSVLHPKGDLLSKHQLPENTEVITWDYNSSFEFEDVDLFILYYLKYSFEHFIKTLKNAAACLKDEGFFLILVKSQLTESERNLSNISELPIPIIQECDLEPLFKELNLNIICKKRDSFTSTLFLLRRHPTSLYKDSVLYINNGGYGQWIDSLKGKMSHIFPTSISERLWLVSNDSQLSGIIGLVNCIRQEPGGHNVRCIFIGNKTLKIPEFSLTNPFYEAQLKKNLVMNVLQNGVWGSYRHIRWNEDSSDADTEHAYLSIRTVGDLSTLEWINSPLKYVTSDDYEALCYVYYASINFKDVMIATGRVSLGAFSGGLTTGGGILGFEFSGRTSDGRRVMGLVSHKGMATSVVANPLFLWDVPDEWSLEEAATIPAAYATVYYALILRGRLKNGERILIHSGSGGVGQAAITIALSIGCDVYTTVGSKEKKEFLMKKFPEIQEGHISNSRNMSFVKDILKSTNGKGVHVVLNSLAEKNLFASLDCLACNGRFLEIGKYDIANNSNLGVHVVLNSLAEKNLFASLDCLACNGRFLEIGKYDIANNSNLGMELFLKNVSFHGVALDAFFNTSDDDMETQIELVKLVKNGIADGVVKPLNTTVFNYHEAQKAFRYMASGRHTGKVLLKIRDEETDRKAFPSLIRITARKQTLFDPKKSYILIGGLGGIGLELSQWLIERGAKSIVLSSRSGITTGYQKICLRRWEQESVQVMITKLNAVKPEEAKSLIQLAAKLGPVGGIFNIALVLRDALMVNQSVQNYLDVCEPKIEITKNLDLLSREFCPELDCFVCFSSAVSGRGNAGQSNYGYANSSMERICEERVNKGLPGLAIQWGAVGDVGYVKETMGSDIILRGTVSQSIRSCLAVLEKFLQQRNPVVTSFVPYELKNDYRKIENGDLMAHLSNMFGINDISSINPEINLSELGMDSLMAVELKQILESNYDTDISFAEMRHLKVKDLKNIANQYSLETTKTKTQFEPIFLGKFNVHTSNDPNQSATIVHMNEITDGVPLFLIHPIEGTVAALETLAKLLPCPVYGIQSTAESPRDSLENLSAWYWKRIKELKVAKEAINLTGYSHGAMVAFEMALQAEQDPSQYPEIQNVIFIEGSHNLLKSYIRLLVSNMDEVLSDVTLQIVVLQLLSWQFSHNINLDTNELLKGNSFPERLRYTIEKVTTAFPNISSDVIETVYQQMSSNVQMSFEYSPRNKLMKDVYLIKATRSLAVVSHLSELYDLEKVCEGKITAHTIEGTHLSILQSSSAEDVARLMKETFNLDKIM